MAHNAPVSPTEQRAVLHRRRVKRTAQSITPAIRRLFRGESGVIMMRPRGDKSRRPRYLLRIPHSVAKRVFRQLAVKPNPRRAA